MAGETDSEYDSEEDAYSDFTEGPPRTLAENQAEVKSLLPTMHSPRCLCCTQQPLRCELNSMADEDWHSTGTAPILG